MNLAFFGLEFILVSGLLLGAYRLRPRLGLSAVVAVVASMQFIQAVLASSFFWPAAGGLYINPGSAILFSANLAILVYAYARDSVLQARTLLYAILVGNLVPGALGALLGWHIEQVEPLNLLGVPPEIFQRGIFVSLVGTVILYIDQMLAVISFAWLRRKWPGVPLAAAMTLSLVLALSFDTVTFLGLLFWDSPDFERLLLSGLVSKGLGGLAFGVVWGIYLQRNHSGDRNSAREVLDILLFQENLSALREAATTDPMTGLYNRRSYDLIIEQLLDPKAAPRVDTFALVLCDADRFKQVNDTLGHTEGDRVLEKIASDVRGAIREQDYAFRLGGDEFVILLPNAGIDEAREVAARLSNFEFDNPELDQPVTLTVGIAAFPEDGTTRSDLFAAADKRLYAGKSAGRGQVVESV